MSNLLRKLPLRSGSLGQDASKSDEQRPSIRQPYAPKPLPSKRKRALTLPLARSNPNSKTGQWTSDQAHCAFLRVLPYDVRRVIYEFVLAGRTFHVIRLRKRLRHVECTRHGRRSSDNSSCWGISTVDGRSVKALETEGFGGGLLDLLRTCRQIYTEGIEILYSRNTFDVNRPESLISLSTILLPQRLDSIAYLQLTWSFFCTRGSDSESPILRGDDLLWKACWRIIAGMKELKNIRLWLAMSPANEMSPQCEQNLLLPLAQIGPKRLFEVRVSWNLKGDPDETEAATMHYRLARQESEYWGASALRLQND
ncbi:MAG: hypothetical protein Q9191_001026 [Dirinaria sp. TL-2023a]